MRLSGSPNECAAASGDGLGCTKTTDLRRSSSAKTGSRVASPRYTPMEFVKRTRPSSLRTSSAYESSSSEACKLVRSCMNEFGREFVAPPRQRPSLLPIAKVDSRRAHRHHGNVDPGV